jgi:Spy/CpxP family protein refolding chaperone
VQQKDMETPQTGGAREKAMKTGAAGRTILAVAGLMFAGVASGQGFGGGHGAGPGFGDRQPPFVRAFGPEGAHKGWWNNPRMVDRLKLTDDQRKAMDDIMLEHREKLIDLHANLEKAELTMLPLMSADTPNDAAIKEQIDKVVQARGDLERADSLFLLAIRDKLTPDQWKQLRTMREEGGMHGQQHQGWNRDGQRPGMRGPGMQGPGGQFRRQGPPAPPVGTPAPASGAGPATGTQQ